MDWQALGLFVIASLSINLIPGPDVVYIVSNSMKGKVSTGLKAAIGLGVGYGVHTIAAVMGLSALILSSALAFSVIKYLGAAYLLYLGFTSLRNAYRGESSLKLEQSGSDKGVFTQGVVVSILNPKVALFFLSFLPQFINFETGDAPTQLLVLGVTFSLLATGCNLAYALLGNLIFSNPKFQKHTRVVEGVSGFLLVGLAGKIALTRN